MPKPLIWRPADSRFENMPSLSTDFYELGRASWPAWASGTTQFRRIWIHAPTSTQLPAGMSTSAVVGRLLTERFDHKDVRPFNYNYYLLAETTSGYIQSGPIRTTDIDHQSFAPIDVNT